MAKLGDISEGVSFEIRGSRVVVVAIDEVIGTFYKRPDSNEVWMRPHENSLSWGIGANELRMIADKCEELSAAEYDSL